MNDQTFNIATFSLYEYGREAAGFLYETLSKNQTIFTDRDEDNPLRILYVGKRSQNYFLRPLIEKINTKVQNKTLIEITTIGHVESELFFSKLAGEGDYSVIYDDDYKDKDSNKLEIRTIPQSNLIKDYLKSKNEQKATKHTEPINNFSFALPLDEQKQDNGYTFDKKNVVNEIHTKYDIIFCFWEFHLDLNWRLAHTHLLRYLKEEGALVFAKGTGDFALFDGNFKYEEEETYLSKLMRSFDEERTNNHFFWNPEISMSDYYQMRKQAEFYFEEIIIDKKKENDINDRHKGYDYSWSKESLKSHFEKQSLSYLKIGLDKEAIKPFIKEIEKFADNTVNFKKRMQYYVARGFKQKEFENIASRHWRYDDLIGSLQKLKDGTPSMLSRKALDTLVSHDIFFPKHTVSCSFFYWLGDARFWDYPVHLINNHVLSDDKPKASDSLDIFKEFLEWMTLEALNDKGVFKYLIKDLKHKVQINFQLYSSDDDIAALKNERKFKGSTDKLAYEFKYNKQRQPTHLILAFTEGVFDKALMQAFFDTSSLALKDYSLTYAESIVTSLIIRDKSPENLGVDLGMTQRFSISEKMEEAFEGFESKHMETLKQSFNKIIEAFTDKKLLADIKGINDIINCKNTLDTDKPKLLGVFISIALFTWGKKDFSLSFYPSAPADQNSEGLGGIVLSENLFIKVKAKLKGTTKTTHEQENKIKKNQIALFMARNNALIEASNQIFYKIGITDYVNHKYKTFAQQSAVAAIISRNGSHGIGSHAIPSLVNDHRDLWQKGNKEDMLAALRDDDIFFKYLQDRFEFITQLGNPTLPKWTLTTWFGKDLMKRFLMQQHLLNNLASSERLKAFAFLHESQRNDKLAQQTDVGDEEEFLYGKLLKNTEGVWHIETTETERESKDNLRRKIEWKKDNEPLISMDYLNKVRVSGQLSVRRGEPYLKEAELIANRILVKVRLRRFLKYNEAGDFANVDGKEVFEDTSDLIGDAIHITRRKDISDIKTKRDKKIEKTGKTEVHYYGIICKTESDKQFYLQMGSDSRICLALRNGFKDGKRLRVGRRVIFTGDLVENQGFINVIIKELICNNRIIHPQNDNMAFENDVPISIVGGIVGYQAFYSILENIIRNAAKHNWQLFLNEIKQSSNLVINIELEDQLDNDSYICKIWTNTTDVRYEKGVEGGEKVEIFDTEKSLVEVLRKKLENPIINSDGKPKQEDIGLSEIKICAAFLAGKDWTEDPSVLMGEKAMLKHKTDRGKDDNDGYIRTFVAWESEQGDTLIPRLGYRFKLLKAKEVLFMVSDTEQLMKPGKEKTEHDRPLWATSKVVFYKDCKKNELDYECCVLIAPDDTRTYEEKEWKEGEAIDLLAYALNYANNWGKETLLEEKTREKNEARFLQLSIQYPHRLLLVCKDAKAKIENLKKLGEKNISQYIRKRITFVEREVFEKAFEDKNTDIRLWCYNQWLCFTEAYKVEGKNGAPHYKPSFELDIKMNAAEGNILAETERMNIPTLPFSLRGDSYEESKHKTENEANTEGRGKENNLEKAVSVFNRTFRQVKIADTHKKVRFERHASFDPHTHFLESLSGGKVSFSIFANIDKMDKHEQTKFFMQLMEAAQNFVLVLDERVMEFASGHAERYDQFENANILVPIEFDINGKVLHKETKQSDIKGEEKRIKIDELTITFKQQKEKLREGKGYVSTVIIHQTLLEKIADSMSDGASKVDKINAFVRALKIENGIPSVIITSGRGKNNNTSDLAKFIPFSDISSLLMQYYPEKWMLNRIITESLH